VSRTLYSCQGLFFPVCLYTNMLVPYNFIACHNFDAYFLLNSLLHCILSICISTIECDYFCCFCVSRYLLRTLLIDMSSGHSTLHTVTLIKVED
jgi:hypothetical protein